MSSNPEKVHGKSFLQNLINDQVKTYENNEVISFE